MFKVTEHFVQAYRVSDGAQGAARTPVGEARRTRDEAEAQRWAAEARDRLARKDTGCAHEVLVYSVIGEPMFDLWAEPQLRGRYRARRNGD